MTSLVALFVALGGSGYAAVTINGSQLKDRSVAGKKLKKDTLTGTEIKESKLGKIPSAASATNARNLGGKAASAYPSNVVIRVKSLTLANNSTAGSSFGGGADDGTAACAAGERVIGGGVRIDTGATGQSVVSSRPSVGDGGVPAAGGTADGWRGVVADTGQGGSPAEVFAICAK